MSKFLTTTGVSYRLEEIIKSANERLVLISPFFKVNNRVKELLEDRDRLKIDVRVVYGKTELHPDENNWLDSLPSIRTSFCENLHAKCYLNENEALLTSMNLYEFSQVNNHEMGVLISRAEEPQLYDEVLEEAMRILRASDEIRVTVASVTGPQPENAESPAEPTESPSARTGFCIRCKTSIPMDLDKPYCNRCFKSWNRFKNDSYSEKHCHSCGKSHTATMSKPACSSCFRQTSKT